MSYPPLMDLQRTPLALPSVLGAVLSLVLLSTAPVRAQLVVAPESMRVSLPQHEEATRTVTLTNTSSATLTYCVSFDRPLQRRVGQARLAEDAAGAAAPCGPYGQVLYRLDERDVTVAGWPPHGITMTPDGRLFTSSSSSLHRTFELTPDLQLVRYFTHPIVAERDPFPGTWGLAYDIRSGTLWWMNGEYQRPVTYRVLLLEGDLDGEATGRRIEIVPPETPLSDFGPGGLSYDPATDRFYFLGTSDSKDDDTRALWAIDRDGVVPEGYPLRPEPYPPPTLIGRPDAHGGAEGGPEGVRVEYPVYPPGAPGYDRIVVVDRWGRDLGAELVTPVPAELFEGWGHGVDGNPLRSRADPNGVMYLTFANFNNAGIVGVRPHPLPPSWLRLDTEAGSEVAWDGTLASGESREVTLTFQAGARPVGSYTASLQVFEAATGVAVEVPLVLEVTLETDVEVAPEATGPLRLGAPYPNPARGAVTVPLALAQSAEIRVAVYDVLGREVAVLADRALEAGRHALPLTGGALPSGTYVVRAEVTEAGGAVRILTQKLVLAR